MVDAAMKHEGNMPIANLIIAQATSAWIAAPFLVSLVLSQATEGAGAYFFYAIAALAALIVLAAGYIGSRLSDAVPKPDVPDADRYARRGAGGRLGLRRSISVRMSNESEAMGYLFTFAPVMAAIVAFFLSATKRL